MQTKSILRKLLSFSTTLIMVFMFGTVNAEDIPYNNPTENAVDKRTIKSPEKAKTGTNIIRSKKGNQIPGAFDIAQTEVSIKEGILSFRQKMHGKAGSIKPESIGKLHGSTVAGYVWPTTMNTSIVGFEADQGILALAITAHPDFDDTPLYDENSDGDNNNDGNEWHTHWVVLVKDDACGKGALKVKDILVGAKPAVPETVPGLPILLDSPGYEVKVSQNTMEAVVPLKNRNFSYDGVTSVLKVNDQGKSPLLCVIQVHDIASGDLSLPGKIL